MQSCVVDSQINRNSMQELVIARIHYYYKVFTLLPTLFLSINSLNAKVAII